MYRSTDHGLPPLKITSPPAGHDIAIDDMVCRYHGGSCPVWDGKANAWTRPATGLRATIAAGGAVAGGTVVP